MASFGSQAGLVPARGRAGSGNIYGKRFISGYDADWPKGQNLFFDTQFNSDSDASPYPQEKGKVYSMCICLKEYADSPHSLRLETTDRCEVVSQRILETSEFIFKTELKIDKINPSDRQNLEENIYIRTETPIIRVNLPSLYEFYDRVTGVSRIMEDCIHESLYDFRKPISILDRMLRKST
jgi:hypothetical protein